MFTQDDKEIMQKYEEVRKEWDQKRLLNEKYKKMKDNFNDFDYYVDSVQLQEKKWNNVEN